MIHTVTLNPALDKTLVASGLLPEVINRARVVQVDWGGKGINVSRALHNLGVESVAMGFLGGAAGTLLQRGLAEVGIQTAFTRIAGETRTNLTIHDRERNALVKLNEAGPLIGTQEMEALRVRIRERIGPGDICVMSGNPPPGVPDDAYAMLVTIVQEGGGRAFLDTSGAPLRPGCAAAPYLIKPNREEAEQVLERELGDEPDLLRALQEFLEMGIKVVLLSLGGDGALAADAHGVSWARPPEVPVRSDIGAGDSLLAGFVHGLTKGWRLPEALRWAVAAGTAAVMEEGTGVCSLARTAELFPQVTLSRL